MARMARCQYIDPHATQIIHVTSRCVRRAFLCGKDRYSGKSFEHRRVWIRERFEFLASVFAIDCLTFAVLSNHLHLVLRSRPDIVQGWSDREVAERWLRLCPPRRNGTVADFQDSDVSMITEDPQQLAELRVRLSDISWWMRMTAQKIAHQANQEDDCTGRFWEGRFKAQVLLDEAAILACAMYVDLNPIRAAMAQSLGESEFTGAKARFDDFQDSESIKKKSATESSSSFSDEESSPVDATNSGLGGQTSYCERSEGRKQSGWLSPLEIKESSDPIGADPSRCGRRASLKGFLSMPLERYLALVDWTGRQLRSDKRGAIPAELAPLLTQLGIAPDRWLDLALRFGKLFKRAAGSSISLTTEANQCNQNWLQAPGASCFG